MQYNVGDMVLITKSLCTGESMYIGTSFELTANLHYGFWSVTLTSGKAKVFNESCFMKLGGKYVGINKASVVAV